MNTELVYKSLVEQLTEALTERIEAEELKPGDRLPATAALVEDYGVSRPVVREALKILEGRGVIEISGGRSAVIRPVSGDVLASYFQRAVAMDRGNLRDVLEVRAGIEVQSARLAAIRRTDAQLAEMQVLVARMREAVDDTGAYAQLDVEFHLLVAEAAHNNLLYYLVSGIRDALHDVIREGLNYRLTGDARNLVQFAHEHIVRQIASQNAGGAVEAMTFHFDDALQTIFEYSPMTND